MKTPVVVLTLVLETAFIVYCIHMTYLLDIQDPMPREWMIPNFWFGAGVLIFGLLVATWLDRDQTTHSRRN